MIKILTFIVCCVILVLLLFYPAYARLMAEIMARQLDEKDIDVKEMCCNFNSEVVDFIADDHILSSVYRSAMAHNFSVCATLNSMVIALVREKRNREKQNTVTNPSVEI